ncbi:hypothetical protein ACI3PL_20470, partial [Lacticaseibacillus paracasei]
VEAQNNFMGNLDKYRTTLGSLYSGAVSPTIVGTGNSGQAGQLYGTGQTAAINTQAGATTNAINQLPNIINTGKSIYDWITS